MADIYEYNLKSGLFEQKGRTLEEDETTSYGFDSEVSGNGKELWGIGTDKNKSLYWAIAKTDGNIIVLPCHAKIAHVVVTVAPPVRSSHLPLGLE